MSPPCVVCLEERAWKMCFDKKMLGESARMKISHRLFAIMIAVPFIVTVHAQQEPAPTTPSMPPEQTAPVYTPKYHGDPAHSDSEFVALAYVRGVMRAEMLFNKHYGHYASALSQLVHTGNFTQRMVNPDRGDYTATFKAKKDGYLLTMAPKTLAPEHRSFYATEDGKIHADDAKPADADSPVVETHKW